MRTDAQSLQSLVMPDSLRLGHPGSSNVDGKPGNGLPKCYMPLIKLGPQDSAASWQNSSRSNKNPLRAL